MSETSEPGQFSEAIQALRSDPNDLEACRLAQHLECAASADRDGAVEHYQAVLQGDNPAVRSIRPLIFYELGEYHRENGRLDLALLYLRKSNELAYAPWRTHLALGLTYFALGNDRDGLGYFQEATRLAPHEVAVAYEHVAEICSRTNNWSKSSCEPFLKRALELYEKKEDLAGAARCRMRLSEEWGGRLEPDEVLDRVQQCPELAEQVLELASRQHPRHAELAFRLGQASAAVGNHRQAGQCFLQVTNLETVRLHGPAYELAADAYRRLELYPEEVRRLYERAIQAYTGFAEEAGAARCQLKLRNCP